MKLRLPWMSRTDRTRWQAARTLEDLGRLTAAWWEGTVDSLPGYPPRRGPAAETLPHVAVLAAANRGGFLTIAAQPGGTDTSHRGVETRQRAAVQGFASDPALICRLVDAAEKAGLEMVLNDMLDANFGPGDGITVTTVDGTPDTVFGYALGIRSLVAMWRGCPGAIGPLGKALQITLADRQFGPSTLLWDTLAATVGPPPLRPPRRSCAGSAAALTGRSAPTAVPAYKTRQTAGARPASTPASSSTGRPSRTTHPRSARCAAPRSTEPVATAPLPACLPTPPTAAAGNSRPPQPRDRPTVSLTTPGPDHRPAPHRVKELPDGNPHHLVLEHPRPRPRGCAHHPRPARALPRPALGPAHSRPDRAARQGRPA